jgi:ABC-type lipoprotein export system ATPase subunit
MPNPTRILLRADALSHRGAPPEELRGVSLAIEPGRFTLLSGYGAGLLLRILGLLERPEDGEVWFDNQRAGRLNDTARLDLRNHAFGFVFAEPFLLDSFTVAENVAMPLFKISGFDIDRARARTAEVLDFTGLAFAADCTVSDLPVLDRHKIALARALANGPQILIAEDAGLQLSPEAFRDFAGLLRSASDRLGISVIATSPAAADILGPDREIRLEHGAIAADSRPVPIEEAPAP